MELTLISIYEYINVIIILEIQQISVIRSSGMRCKLSKFNESLFVTKLRLVGYIEEMDLRTRNDNVMICIP